jgi:hypothetical protein
LLTSARQLTDIRNKQGFLLVLLMIVLIGFVLRLLIIDHHLPHTIVEDEGSDLSTAMRLVAGELPPPHVRYHRSLIAYHDLFAVALKGGVDLLTGQVTSIDEFQAQYFAQRHEFTIATRLLMVFLTSATIFVIGITGRYIDPLVGIFSALYFTINGFITANSVYALPDALVMLPTSLVMYFGVRIAVYNRTLDYVASGVAIALVMLAKLQGSVVAIFSLMAHIYYVWRNTTNQTDLFARLLFNRKPWLLLLAIVFGNILFNPLPFLMINDLVFEIQRAYGMFLGGETSSLSIDAVVQITYAALYELVLVVLLFDVMFLLLAVPIALFSRWSALRWMILSTALVVFLFILRSQLGATSKIYYWTPFLVVGVLVSGMVATWLIAQVHSGGIRRILLIPLAVSIIVPSLYSLHLIRLVSNPSTQDMALEFVETNIPSGSPIVAPDPTVYGIPLQRNEISILRAIELGHIELRQWEHWLGQSQTERRSPSFDIYSWENQGNLHTWDDLLELLNNNDIEYYITADYCQGFSMQPGDTGVLEYPPVDPKLMESWELVATSSPFGHDNTSTTQCVAAVETRTGLARSGGVFSQARVGPLIYIYRLPSTD